MSDDIDRQLTVDNNRRYDFRNHRETTANRQRKRQPNHSGNGNGNVLRNHSGDHSEPSLETTAETSAEPQWKRQRKRLPKPQRKRLPKRLWKQQRKWPPKPYWKRQWKRLPKLTRLSSDQPSIFAKITGIDVVNPNRQQVSEKITGKPPSNSLQKLGNRTNC